MAVFALPITLLASGLGISAGAAGAALGSIVTTAAGIGLSLLTRPSTPQPENGTFAVQQPLPPRIYAYGTCRIAGYVAFMEATATLVQVNALVGHRCHNVLQFFMNDQGVYTGGPYVSGGTGSPSGGNCQGLVAPYYGAYNYNSVSMGIRLGLDTQTVFGEAKYYFPQWDNNHRGDQVTSLVMLCQPVDKDKFAQVYPFGRPLPSAVLETALVYDPRDPDQDPHDEGTFRFSRNPVLCILHFQCFSRYGPQRNYDTAVLPIVDDWIEEANICDEQVLKKDESTEPRYQCGGFTDTDKDSRTTLQTLLATCDGWFVERGDGTIKLVVGKYRTPTVELTDDDITGFYFQTGVAAEENANSVVGTYAYPPLNFKTVDTDPYDDDEDQVKRGRRIPGRLELTWVQSTGQASRLVVRETIRNKEKVRGRLSLKLSALNACYERWVLISSSIPRLDGQVIENRKPVLSLMDGACSLEFLGSGAGIDEYDPSSQESNPPNVATVPPQDGPPMPLDFSATVITTADATKYIQVTFDAPQDASGAPRYDLTFAVHTRLVGASAWSEQDYSSYTVSSAGRITLQTNLVPSNELIDVAVSSKTSSGWESDWTPAIRVSSSDTSVTPDAPTDLTATPGSGQVALVATNPNNPSFFGVQFYRSAHDALFSAATKLGPEIYGSPNGSSSYTDHTATSGTTYDYWATSLNRAGAESASFGPVAATPT